MIKAETKETISYKYQLKQDSNYDYYTRIQAPNKNGRGEQNSRRQKRYVTCDKAKF